MAACGLESGFSSSIRPIACASLSVNHTPAQFDPHLARRGLVGLEHRLPGARRVAARDDVDDDRRDVVARAALERETDQCVDAALARRVLEQDALQGVALDDVRET